MRNSAKTLLTPQLIPKQSIRILSHQLNFQPMQILQQIARQGSVLHFPQLTCEEEIALKSQHLNATMDIEDFQM
ncbi:hypothetical protein SS50377_27001 [Spironucleus salmonicida]|uniref:Uncharacterized protein n=1 Tax=Spironucleus salmonicida TaxID=348837 RepID=V6LTD1_9EUKA|nr:hypothetical protein SS50377_27001 [Spironucleus salmonicida]|eukprot:EST47513.1 Hypothetical protein SS50377_fx056 [Spironucleus salmonicida]